MVPAPTVGSSLSAAEASLYHVPYPTAQPAPSRPHSLIACAAAVAACHPPPAHSRQDAARQPLPRRPLPRTFPFLSPVGSSPRRLATRTPCSPIEICTTAAAAAAAAAARPDGAGASRAASTRTRMRNGCRCWRCSCCRRTPGLGDSGCLRWGHLRASEQHGQEQGGANPRQQMCQPGRVMDLSP